MSAVRDVGHAPARVRDVELVGRLGCDLPKDGHDLVHRGDRVPPADEVPLAIALDQRQLDVLQWHCDRLDRENEKRRKRYPLLAESMSASELLFPAPPPKWNHGGGFRSTSALAKMFEPLGTLLKLGYEVTPRCMRRTYQDLCRAANVADIVTPSISGHATEDMQRNYSTVSADEQRAGLAAVIDLATERAKRAA